MWLGILMCILAVQKVIQYFETKQKKYLFFSLLLMLLANFSYQGVVGIFLSISFVYILKYSKYIKQFIINNLIVGFVYAIPALLDFVLVKILYKASRINGKVIFLESLKIIIQNTQNMYIKMYDLLPKYAFILLILFTFTAFWCKICKENKKFLNLLNYFYIICGITIVSVTPQIMQPTNSIWFGPRSTYSFASMYGILVLYLVTNFELEKILEKSIIILSLLLIVFQL